MDIFNADFHHHIGIGNKITKKYKNSTCKIKIM